jgi:hypothetical protein
MWDAEKGEVNFCYCMKMCVNCAQNSLHFCSVSHTHTHTHMYLKEAFHTLTDAHLKPAILFPSVVTCTCTSPSNSLNS